MSAGQQAGNERAPGDVLDYIPDRESRHCRESCAVVREDGRIFDTFWSGPKAGLHGADHELSDRELATAGLRFRLGDYREVKYEQEWLTFAPADRQYVSAQQGLQWTYYVREGAEPDLTTQIDNARGRVAEAERAVESAKASLERRRRELADLEAQR